MPTILTAREVEAMLRAGQTVPADARLTPSARDLVEDQRRNGRAVPLAAAKPAVTRPAPTGTPAAPSTPDYEFRWTPGSDPKSPADIQRFFTSPVIEELKIRICDIGRRLWEREYTDGNGGNITIRVGDNLALCTPTLICKGFMKPADICLVDLDGNQLAGTRKRTSEAMTHFGIMKRQPAAKSCVHAHPPHATAFAIANAQIPSCLIPEAEVFLGKIGVAKYQTPGTKENADAVGEIGINHQAVLMQNHGVIVWGKDVEDAYWKMENIDSYCRTVAIAGGLGSGLHRFGTDKLKDLINLRQALGMPDPRASLAECELCNDNSEFRPGAVCPPTPSTEGAPPPSADPEIEDLVQTLTNEILRQLATAK